MVHIDTSEIKEQIANLNRQIADSRLKLHARLEQIRGTSRSLERDALDYHYAEIVPLQRQIDAMTLACTDYESLGSR
jgi:hypothetical protein